MGLKKALKYWPALTVLLCGLTAIPASADSACDVEWIVLGAGQDAGAPQIGVDSDRAWTDQSLELWPTSAALIDHRSGARYLFEATPRISAQLRLLRHHTKIATPSLAIAGVFVTHAHIGHYAGLMYFGREAAGATSIPVFAMPRMLDYLSNNGPWSQLLALNNVAPRPLVAAKPTRLADDLFVVPLVVPHRDEFSETVGLVVVAGESRLLFLPDIDSWDAWIAESDMDIAKLLVELDYAFIDATFFDDNELPGRDMSEIPHPRVADTMRRLSHLSRDERNKVHFIHYNHTNAIRYRGSAQTQQVRDGGFHVARRGNQLCLLASESA